MDFSKVIGQTVRQIKREVNKKVLKLPEIEQKVLEATSNEPWGPHGTLMANIAQGTHNYGEYPLIMAILWRRMADTGKNWRHVYKSLLLLEYMVGHGSGKVIEEIRDNMARVRSLLDFQYVEQNGKDQGVNIRKKAQSLIGLVSDKEKVREVRYKAAANRQKYRGTSSVGDIHMPGTYGGGSPRADQGPYSSGRYSRVDDRWEGADRYAEASNAERGGGGGSSSGGGGGGGGGGGEFTSQSEEREWYHDREDDNKSEPDRHRDKLRVRPFEDRDSPSSFRGGDRRGANDDKDNFESDYNRNKSPVRSFEDRDSPSSFRGGDPRDKSHVRSFEDRDSPSSFRGGDLLDKSHVRSFEDRDSPSSSRGGDRRDKSRFRSFEDRDSPSSFRGGDHHDKSHVRSFEDRDSPSSFRGGDRRDKVQVQSFEDRDSPSSFSAGDRRNNLQVRSLEDRDSPSSFRGGDDGYPNEDEAQGAQQRRSESSRSRGNARGSTSQKEASRSPPSYEGATLMLVPQSGAAHYGLGQDEAVMMQAQKSPSGSASARGTRFAERSDFDFDPRRGALGRGSRADEASPTGSLSIAPSPEGWSNGNRTPVGNLFGESQFRATPSQAMAPSESPAVQGGFANGPGGGGGNTGLAVGVVVGGGAASISPAPFQPDGKFAALPESTGMTGKTALGVPAIIPIGTLGTGPMPVVPGPVLGTVPVTPGRVNPGATTPSSLPVASSTLKSAAMPLAPSPGVSSPPSAAGPATGSASMKQQASGDASTSSASTAGPGTPANAAASGTKKHPALWADALSVGLVNLDLKPFKELPKSDVAKRTDSSTTAAKQKLAGTTWSLKPLPGSAEAGLAMLTAAGSSPRPQPAMDRSSPRPPPQAQNPKTPTSPVPSPVAAASPSQSRAMPPGEGKGI
ncbi:hypothetical protein CBR_g72434 [Chara braunii]|uniref:ENTH domain-containing protein n=1 Tax=Chara braunii TaxID=69332 RepID=A0A388MG96_CHABU|nr:hypothetical protein CBR_g72434 [Chara braunii]|eukprot:GBG93509.1 hypothetical protein CBR_g72434 [Chara braunii]